MFEKKHIVNRGSLTGSMFVSFDTPVLASDDLTSGSKGQRNSLPVELLLRRQTDSKSEEQFRSKQSKLLTNNRQITFGNKKDLYPFETPRLDSFVDVRLLESKEFSVEKEQQNLDDNIFEIAADAEELQVTEKQQKSLLSNFADSQMAKKKTRQISDTDPISLILS